MEIKSIVNLPGKFWRVIILRETDALVDFAIIVPSTRPRENLFVVLQDLIKIFQNLKSVGITVYYLNSLKEFSPLGRTLPLDTRDSSSTTFGSPLATFGSNRAGVVYISTDECVVKVRGFYTNGKTWSENYDANGSWVPTII